MHFIFFKIQMSQLSTVRATQNGLYGKDVAYALVDYVFHRKLFTLVTWSGTVRKGPPKDRLSKYSCAVNFFFDLIHAIDDRYTKADVEDFLKDIVQNSKRRYETIATGGKQRESRCKRTRKSITSKKENVLAAPQEVSSAQEMDLNQPTHDEQAAILNVANDLQSTSESLPIDEQQNPTPNDEPEMSAQANENKSDSENNNGDSDASNEQSEGEFESSVSTEYS